MQFTTRDQRLVVLEHSWLFQAVSQADREALAPRCSMTRYRRGARIVGRGLPGQCLYVVAQGRVKGTLPSPTGQAEFLIGLVWPGDFFGEVSVLANTAALGNALAMTDVQLLSVPRAEMLALLERRPQFHLRMMGVLADKLRTALDLSLSLRFLDVPSRFYQRLSYLARFDCQEEEGGGLRIRHGLSQQELADSIGASREALNKVIGDWKRDGVLEWGRGYVVLRDLASLSARMPVFLRETVLSGTVSPSSFGPWPAQTPFSPPQGKTAPETGGRTTGGVPVGAHWNRAREGAKSGPCVATSSFPMVR